MPSLLSKTDGPAYHIINGAAQKPLLLVCDHASNRVPSRLGDLGVSAEEFQRHIAWDLGAARVTTLMAERLNCTAILSAFSRLVIDVNRPFENEDLIALHSFGTDIPGNRNLSHEDRQARIQEIFVPYHEAIASKIQELRDIHPFTKLALIHSFGPYAMPNTPLRPWEIGIVWNRDAETAHRLMTYLRAKTNYRIGDNEPYSMKKCRGYTMETHAEDQGPCTLIEIRNDLIRDETGCAQIADLLAGFFEDEGEG